MDVLSTIASISFTLFLLMDSIGNVPLFISILKNFNPQEQRKIIRREMLIALAIIIGFSFLGEYFLNLLNVKPHTILITGGIILFLISINMIFPSPSEEEKKNGSLTKEPFIVPLAIPLIAGPAVLAAVMIYAKQENSFVTISAIVLAWLASISVLLSASFLKNFLGEKGLSAGEKLMGLILTLIAVKMCLEGITLYILEVKSLT